MIDKKVLEDFAVKKETGYLNVAREYIQNLFLAKFYQKKGSEHFLFKGGTALRIVFGSPRFSEDLDFTGINNGRNYENILEGVLYELSLENLKPELLESKPTSGGYLSSLAVNLFDEKIVIREEVSLRPAVFPKAETILISSEMSPSYNLFLLERKNLITEKAEALISRQKIRDFFDLYFILRNENLRKWLKLTREQREIIFNLLGERNQKEIDRELKNLLPRSYWPIVKDLPTVLKRELGKE